MIVQFVNWKIYKIIYYIQKFRQEARINRLAYFITLTCTSYNGFNITVRAKLRVCVNVWNNEYLAFQLLCLENECFQILFIMARWRYDTMALWSMALWYDSVMIWWRYDMMVLWYDGAMIRWRYDMMALWYDVPFYFLAPKNTVKLFSFPFLTSSLHDEDNFRNTSCILDKKSTFSLGIYLLNVFKVSVVF